MTVCGLCLFLTVPWVGLQCVIMVFPGHTHLLFAVCPRAKHFHLVARYCKLEFYFRETSHMRSLVKIKSSQNGEITPSFTDRVMSCPSCEFLASKVCYLTLFAKIKFSRKFSDLQYCSPLMEALLNRFSIRKFHAEKNWYQFLPAREELVPSRQAFHTKLLTFERKTHVVKFYVAIIRVPHIDKIAPKAAVFCFRFQFFTRIS